MKISIPELRESCQIGPERDQYRADVCANFRSWERDHFKLDFVGPGFWHAFYNLQSPALSVWSRALIFFAACRWRYDSLRALDQKTSICSLFEKYVFINPQTFCEVPKFRALLCHYWILTLNIQWFYVLSSTFSSKQPILFVLVEQDSCFCLKSSRCTTEKIAEKSRYPSIYKLPRWNYEIRLTWLQFDP